MTKKIVWRLKEQPTSENLRELVKDKILTNDEAREILFSSQEETERDKKSLEDEIKFLRELVEKLSQNKSQIIEVIKEIRVPYYKDYWFQPYIRWQDNIVLCQNTTNYLQGTAMSNLQNCSFSSIETF
jgi:hypothetical protein